MYFKSVVNDDPSATPANGKKVYGIHSTFRNMDVAGDLYDQKMKLPTYETV